MNARMKYPRRIIVFAVALSSILLCCFLVVRHNKEHDFMVVDHDWVFEFDSFVREYNVVDVIENNSASAAYGNELYPFFTSWVGLVKNGDIRVHGRSPDLKKAQQDYNDYFRNTLESLGCKIRGSEVNVGSWGDSFIYLFKTSAGTSGVAQFQSTWLSPDYDHSTKEVGEEDMLWTYSIVEEYD